MTSAVCVCVQVQCCNGSLLEVLDDQLYSVKEKLPRKVKGKVKVHL